MDYKTEKNEKEIKEIIHKIFKIEKENYTEKKYNDNDLKLRIRDIVEDKEK